MHVELPSASSRDRFLLLRSNPAFEALDDEDIQLMAEYTRPETFEAGTVVTEEGEPHRFVYLVYEGTVRTSSQGRTLMTLQAPSGFGYMAALGGSKTTFRAEAVTRISALSLPVPVMLESMQTNFRFVRNGLRLNAEELLDLRGNLPVSPRTDYVADPGPPVDRARTLVETMLVLSTSVLFEGANIDAIIEMARHTKSRRVEAGTTLWSIGDVATESLQVMHGLITCTSPDGQQVDIGTDFGLGAMDVLSGRPRAYEAKAKTDVFMTSVRRDHMLSVIEAHPDLGIKLLQLLVSARYQERFRSAEKDEP